jgi:hypothetical protein
MPSIGQHKMLIAMALFAVAYCVSAPVLGNLLARVF